MSRYLNEGAVWSAVKRIPHITMQTRQAILEALRKVPSADVAEVVRCKDYKHFDKNKGYRDTKFSFSFCDKFHHNITTENDFCSYGERMDGMGGETE